MTYSSAKSRGREWINKWMNEMDGGESTSGKCWQHKNKQWGKKKPDLLAKNLIEIIFPMTCVSPWREYNFSLHCLRMYAHNKKPDCCQYVFECVFRWEGGRVCSSVRKPDSWMNLLCYFGLLCLIPDRVAGTKLNATSFLQKKVKKNK